MLSYYNDIKLFIISFCIFVFLFYNFSFMSWCFIFLSFCIRTSHRKTIWPPYICLKRVNRFKMESFVLSPMSPNLDLIPNTITVSVSPKNVMVSATEVCNPETPSITHKKVNLPEAIYLMLESSFSHPFYLQKPFILCSS